MNLKDRWIKLEKIDHFFILLLHLFNYQKEFGNLF